MPSVRLQKQQSTNQWVMSRWFTLGQTASEGLPPWSQCAKTVCDSSAAHRLPPLSSTWPSHLPNSPRLYCLACWSAPACVVCLLNSQCVPLPVCLLHTICLNTGYNKQSYNDVFYVCIWTLFPLPYDSGLKSTVTHSWTLTLTSDKSVRAQECHEVTSRISYKRLDSAQET